MTKKSQSVDQVLLHARSLVKKGEIDAARQLYGSLLEKFPGNVRAADGLKSLAVLGRKPAMATPGSLDSEIHALLDLYNQGRLQEALTLGAMLAARYPQSPQIPNILGAVKTLMSRVPDAIASYREAIRIQPDYAEAHHNLANALRAIGQRSEALASYAKAIAIRADYAEAHRNLSTLKTFTLDDPQLAGIEQLLDSPGLPDKERMHLCFALGKAYEDVGEVDRSFANYVEGNRLRKKAIGYDIRSDRKLFAEIKSMFVSGVRPRPPPEFLSAAPKSRPIFIVGMPRSGTTLVEQILASHSQVHGAGELGHLNTLAGRALGPMRLAPPLRLSAESLASVRAGYRAALNNMGSQKALITDKMPSNFRWVGVIAAALPEAKIICVQRDPVATCWSAFKTYFATNGNGFTNDLVDVAEYFNLYRDLMAFWRGAYPNLIYDLDYEALTEDQETQTRMLLQFCGLDWEDACLEFHTTKRAVETASASQVRQKMYKGSSQSWRKYEKHLGPLLDAIEAGRMPQRAW